MSSRPEGATGTCPSAFATAPRIGARARCARSPARSSPRDRVQPLGRVSGRHPRRDRRQRVRVHRVARRRPLNPRQCHLTLGANPKARQLHLAAPKRHPACGAPSTPTLPTRLMPALRTTHRLGPPPSSPAALADRYGCTAHGTPLGSRSAPPAQCISAGTLTGPFLSLISMVASREDQRNEMAKIEGKVLSRSRARHCVCTEESIADS